MSASEAKRFLAGEGCPTCDWGKKKPKGLDPNKTEMEFLSDLTEETDLDPIDLLSRVKPRPK